MDGGLYAVEDGVLVLYRWNDGGRGFVKMPEHSPHIKHKREHSDGSTDDKILHDGSNERVVQYPRTRANAWQSVHRPPQLRTF